MISPNNWPDSCDIQYGDISIRRLSKMFKVDEQASVRGFREYKDFPSSLNDNIKPLMNAVKTLAISSAEYKINAELNKRFSNNEDLLMGISVLDPSNSNFLDKKLIHPFALSYMCDIDTLDSELNIIRKSLKQFEAKYHSIKTIFQFHKFLLDYQLAFFELYKLCTIAITIPVSSAACERTFSCPPVNNFKPFPYIKTWLVSGKRSAMEENCPKRLKVSDNTYKSIWSCLKK
ncbi:hypothetical protein QTP88_019112 [Uroleucon formosanum]